MLTNFKSICIATCVSAAAFHSQADELTIVVSNIKHYEGTIQTALYSSENAYNGQQPPVAATITAANSEEVIVTFSSIEPGQYAVKLYHDENGNGQLDTNMLGMPKEGYGFSNNAGHLGPAKFSEAMFNVEGKTNINIKVR